jgi:hypothetical protein
MRRKGERGRRRKKEKRRRETLSASRKLNLAARTSSKHVGPTGPVSLPSFTSLSTSSLPLSLSLSPSLALYLSLSGIPAIVKRLFYKSFRRETWRCRTVQGKCCDTCLRGVFENRSLVRERNYQSDKGAPGKAPGGP